MGIHAAVLQIRLVVGDWIPVCQARVKHPAERFGRLMGWVQVICSGPPSHLTGEFDPWVTFSMGLNPLSSLIRLGARTGRLT
jgi:hypothetical protein